MNLRYELMHREMPPMVYRPDVDGLRALAVVPIVLFHLGLAQFSGGFVGVDIFFVVSGFLIGGITIREVERGEFSLARFYQRRIRRIVPALIFMLLGTLLAGAFLLLPSEFEELGLSVLPSLAFSANIFFFLEADYFSPEAHSTPLLHLWSLGIEEQFYLFFPLIALALFRMGRSKLWLALAGIAVISALYSLAITASHPQANFYLLPSRAWELLLGVMVAITPVPFLANRLIREMLAVAGLAAICWAIFAFHQYTPFPGWRAAIPCGGAAAIILAGSYGRTVVGSLLGLSPFTMIGKISYSLYLWHWPIIVFLLLGLPATSLSPFWQVVAGLASVILAAFSWAVVEQPFRQKSFKVRPLLIWAGSTSGAVALAAAVLIVTGGWPARFDPRTQQIAAALEYPQDEALRAGTCFLIDDLDTFSEDLCLRAENGRPRVLLIGDSHAAHLWPGLSNVFRQSSIMQATASGCRPLIVQEANTSQRCRDLIGWIYEDYLPDHQTDLIILSGFWKQGDMEALEQSLRSLREDGKNVLVVGPAPAWTIPVPRLLALANIRNDDGLADRFLDRGRWPLDREMSAIARRNGADYFSIIDQRCDPNCAYFDGDNNPLVVDDAHLTAKASQLLATHVVHPALRR